jgi:hypothetical protein
MTIKEVARRLWVGLLVVITICILAAIFVGGAWVVANYIPTKIGMIAMVAIIVLAFMFFIGDAIVSDYL